MKNPVLGESSALSSQRVPVLAHVAAVNRLAELFNPGRPVYTGRFFAVADPQIKNFKQINALFKRKAGLSVASFNDFVQNQYSVESLNDSDVLIYDHLGVALISGTTDQIARIATRNDNYFLVPEKVTYVPDDIDFISIERQTTGMVAGLPAGTLLSKNYTWGLEQTKVIDSAFTGKDIKIAILDTGFDFTHRDFAGRTIVSQSFVPGETAEDQHGHGTHCTGTACGDRTAEGLRYGAAPESSIYIGKVLGNNGSGAQNFVLDGMTWAADQGCQVISMSLTTPVAHGDYYDIVYERAAKYANSKGAIVVAAAGNESRRSQAIFRPVSSPAECPSVIGVAAVDSAMNVADFSNRSQNRDANIDIAAPGVDIFSSWLAPELYRNLSGTSMATPHVAGILALYWQKNPHFNYQQITAEMFKFAKRLAASSQDVGNGLGIAP